MHPYSHFVLAKHLEPYLDLANKQEYYLGAVIPDIRYYVKLDRDKTHFPLEDVAAYLVKYPKLKSFITGYLVHIIADSKRLDPILPLYLRPVFYFLPKCMLQVLIEFYYMENVNVTGQISANTNTMLDSLGIKPGEVTTFAKNINSYVNAPSLEKGIEVAKNLKIFKHPDSNRYYKAAMRINSSNLKKKLISRFNEQKFRNKMTSDLLSTFQELAPDILKNNIE